MAVNWGSSILIDRHEQVFDTRAVSATSSSARSGPAALAELDRLVRPVVPAGERTLPVDDALAELFPAGLPRGVTVTVSGGAARSFALALAAASSRAGSWLAVVGVPGLGWRAAAELGIVAARVVVIDVADDARGADCIAAALDGFDVVLIGAGVHLVGSTERRLAARARERGSVLIAVHEAWAQGHWLGATGENGGRGVFGEGGGGGRGVFGEGADLRVVTNDHGWTGLGAGSGRLIDRQVSVAVEGKRVPGRRRRADLVLPGPDGRVQMPVAVPPPVLAVLT